MNNKKADALIIIGLILLFSAFVWTSYNTIDNVRAKKAAESAADELLKDIETKTIEKNGSKNENLPDYILNPDADMPVRKIDGKEYIGVLRIPGLSLKLPVLSDWSYENLTVSPCRYFGSVYKNNMIIAAHNYWSHFGSLRALKPGDRVSFTDVKANRFNYEVRETEVLTPDQVEEMKTGNWDLTLFTCTFGGEYRITVRCRLLER